jgi:hypothetical protein
VNTAVLTLATIAIMAAPGIVRAFVVVEPTALAAPQKFSQEQCITKIENLTKRQYQDISKTTHSLNLFSFFVVEIVLA